MDECCLISESTDMTLLQKMDSNFSKHPHYESYSSSRNRKLNDTSFLLKHYAGDVTFQLLLLNSFFFFLSHLRLLMTLKDSWIRTKTRSSPIWSNVWIWVPILCWKKSFLPWTSTARNDRWQLPRNSKFDFLSFLFIFLFISSFFHFLLLFIFLLFIISFSSLSFRDWHSIERFGRFDVDVVGLFASLHSMHQSKEFPY